MIVIMLSLLIILFSIVTRASEIKDGSELTEEPGPSANCFAKPQLSNPEQTAVPFDLAMVGGDLARDFAKQHAKKMVRVATVEPINIDALPGEIVSGNLRDCKTRKDPQLCYGAEFKGIDEQSHGVGVIDLAMGRSTNSASNLGVLVMVGDPNTGHSSSAKIQEIFPPLIDKYKPDIILSSASLILGKGAEPLISFIGKKGVVLSNSAGNHYPGPSYPLLKLNPDAISVGAICDHGLVCGFSAEGEDVTILSTTHSYTSQAQPLVAGSIMNVMAMLPGITPQEIKELLRKTAQPAANIHGVNNNPKETNGAGVLNAYKMVRVAHRLQNGWPRNRMRLREDELYNFDQEVESIIKKIQAQKNCGNEEVNLLRAAYFLSPNNLQIQKLLLRAFHSTNRLRERQFLNGLISPIDLQKLRDMYRDEPTNYIERRFVQMRSWPDVKKIISNENDWSAMSYPSPLMMPMNEAISKFGKKAEIEALLRVKIKSSDATVVKNAIRIGTQLEGLNNEHYYRLCLKNKELASDCVGDYFMGSKIMAKIINTAKGAERKNLCKMLAQHTHLSYIAVLLEEDPKLKIRGCF